MIELNNDMYEAKIQDLAPGETYDVKVLSENEVGDGMFSKTVRITTRSVYYLSLWNFDSWRHFIV